jgi:hypothetical protein
MGENRSPSQPLGYRKLFTLFEEIASGIGTILAGLRGSDLSCRVSLPPAVIILAGRAASRKTRQCK